MYSQQLDFTTKTNYESNFLYNDRIIVSNLAKAPNRSHISTKNIHSNYQHQVNNLDISTYSNREEFDPYYANINNIQFSEKIASSVNQATPLVYNNFIVSKTSKKPKKNVKLNPLLPNYISEYNYRNKIINKSKKTKSNKNSKIQGDFVIREYKGGLFDNTIKTNELLYKKIKEKKDLKETIIKKEFDLNFPRSNLQNYGNKEMRLIDIRNHIYALQCKLKMERTKKEKMKNELADNQFKKIINKSVKNVEKLDKNNNHNQQNSQIKARSNNHSINFSYADEKLEINKYETLLLPSIVIPNINILLDYLIEDIISEQVIELNKIEKVKENRKETEALLNVLTSKQNVDLLKQINDYEDKVLNNLQVISIKPYISMYDNTLFKIQEIKYKSCVPIELRSKVYKYKEMYKDYQHTNGVYFTKNVFDLYSTATEEIFREVISDEIHKFSINNIDFIVNDILKIELINYHN